MFCHPFICGFPPVMFMAASWDATVCDTTGTVSGSVVGVTTTPFDRVTEDGIPPSGHRPGFASHQ
jgi:hypothetical protein